MFNVEELYAFVESQINEHEANICDITLLYVDGTEKSFEWQPGYNLTHTPSFQKIKILNNEEDVVFETNIANLVAMYIKDEENDLTENEE